MIGSPSQQDQLSIWRATLAYLALVAPTGATDGDTLSDDQLQDPLEQTRVLGVLEDALDDVEPVRSECDAECLYNKTALQPSASSLVIGVTVTACGTKRD